MAELPHLRIEGTEESSRYTSVVSGPVGAVFELPARNRPVHSKRIRAELEAASADGQSRRAAENNTYPQLVHWVREGLVLTFRSDPGRELKLEQLEDRRSGIILLSLSTVDERQVAKVFVPEGKLNKFLTAVDRYANSVVLTFTTASNNAAALRALEDPNRDVKFRGPMHVRDGSTKLRFVMPESERSAFEARVGSLGTLLEATYPSKEFVESVASVRLALIEDFWQDRIPFPAAETMMWWEVWLRGNRADAVEVHSRFVEIAGIVGITQISDRHVAFPERVVVHAYTSARQLAASVDLLALLAELRQAKVLASHFINQSVADQATAVRSAVARIVPPKADAPSVCVLDMGVKQGHPLISPVLSPADSHAVDQTWGVDDSDPDQHGTGMAGIATYGCLTEVLNGTGAIVLRHKLESVKILPPPPAINEPPDYGRIMQDGVAKAMIQAPRRNRAICMAVTADARDQGLPTLWSGAVDDMTAGVLDEASKLMFISTGNVRGEFFKPDYGYHTWNVTRAGIEDPAQAWNALTIGAFTDKVMINDPSFNGWQPIAEAGDLCPTSRTSLPWPSENHKGWPIKPDLVMEGGNYAFLGKDRSSIDDLSLLTTILHPSGRLVEATRDTSPATAAAARYAAIIWSHYPRLRPETVRALLVHSATWTPKMRERFTGDQKSVIHRCLRCYGYGVPNLQRALNSAENIVNLIFEGELQPFAKEDTVKTYEMHVHTIPWPIDVLESLGETPVTMRITLSYFIQPSPANVGWGVNHRYASHGLRFDVIRLPGETLEEFKRRISRAEWPDKKQRPQNVQENRNWVVGESHRTHGSLHCDWWLGKAVELAHCNKLVVYPVSGWWKDRPHLKCYDRRARYSLIVSIEAPDVDVDLYTPVSIDNSVQTELMV